jgi:hypothetical protein
MSFRRFPQISGRSRLIVQSISGLSLDDQFRN